MQGKLGDLSLRGHRHEVFNDLGPELDGKQLVVTHVGDRVLDAAILASLEVERTRDAEGAEGVHELDTHRFRM